MVVRKNSAAAASREAVTHKPGGKREQNKRANRSAILDAARKCFLQHGYESVTIRDVIRQTGLASGTFYNYFQEKSELLHALVEERLKALTTRLKSARRAADNVEQFLYNAYLAAFEEFTSQPAFYAMMFRNEPVIRNMYGRGPLGLSMRALNQDLRTAITRGLLPEVDTDYMTAILFGAGYEMARVLVEKKNKDPREAAAFATQIFLNGVKNATTRPHLLRRGPITHQGSAR
jgi:AcrR family transcriptional regulator